MNEYMEYLAKIIPEKDSLKLVKNEAEKYYRNLLDGVLPENQVKSKGAEVVRSS